MKLRVYQSKAVNSAIQDLKQHKQVLLVLATASGKSLINAAIAIRAAKKGLKVLCLCHQAEILIQNDKALKGLDNTISTSIYCASLKKKDVSAQVVFASRDSLIRFKGDLNFDLVIADEAHTLSNKKTSSYYKILNKINPKYLVGLTATPWRGKVCIFGKSAIFKKLSANIGIKELTDQGFLVPVITKNNVIIDSSKIKKSIDDFNIKDLEKISKPMEIIDKAIDSWIELASNRTCSLFFCVSIAHAKAVYENLVNRFGTSFIGYLDGKAKLRDREIFFNRAKDSQYKAIVSVGTLTTGVNITCIDCVVLLRATMSPALYVQMIGRGLRLHEGKENLLLLDFTDNKDRFKSLEEPLEFITQAELKKKKLAPTGKPNTSKDCPNCSTKIKSRATHCGFCGYLFINHDFVINSHNLKTINIESYDIVKAVTKAGEDCMIITINNKYKKWLLYKRNNFFGKQARAIMYSKKEFTKAIIEKSGGYWNIKEILH